MRTPESAMRAKRKGAIDKDTPFFEHGVKGADLVILAGPISTIINQLKVLVDFVEKDAIVIDVGSTKFDICKTAEAFFDARRPKNAPKFVGCHPMVGSEKKGVTYSKEGMFDKTWCWIAKSKANKKTIKKIQKFWKLLGSKSHFIDPDSHDYVVAHVSHLPHIVSFAMFQGIRFKKIPLTNRSVKEFVRLSKSDADLWADIILSNNKQVLHALKRFITNLHKWRVAIVNHDLNRLKSYITDANKQSYYLHFKEV